MRILLALACVVFCLVFFTPAVAGQETADIHAADVVSADSSAAQARKVRGRQAWLMTGGGVFPHIAAGGPWRTLITLFNAGTTTATGVLSVYSSTGTPLEITWTNRIKTVKTPALGVSLPPSGTMYLEMIDLPAITQVGYAKLEVSSGKLTGYAVFRAIVPGMPNLEAVVPLEWGLTDSALIAFDNTAGFVTSVALANPWPFFDCDLIADVFDEFGNLLASYRRRMSGQTHTAFETFREWPSTAGRRGSVRLSQAGGLGFAGLALLFNPSGSVTSAPFVEAR